MCYSLFRKFSKYYAREGCGWPLPRPSRPCRTRCGGRYLNLLKGGRLTAGEIAGQFDMTAATVSYHLSQLKKAGLIFESREKNYIYYSLNASVLEEVLLWLQDLKGEGKK